jgi:hypothetical protein
VPFQVAQGPRVDFVVEVADVADDRAVFHRAHVIHRDDVLVACGGDEDVGARGGVFHGDDFETFHGGLQRADRVDFGHHHAAPAMAQGFGRTFAHIAKAADNSHLPAIITSVARRMASTQDSRQPYLLSNFDLVTESLTLMAGQAIFLPFGRSYKRSTPVVVSSEMPGRLSSMGVFVVHDIGEVAAVIEDHVQRSSHWGRSRSSAQCTNHILRGFRLSTRKLGGACGGDGGGGMVLGGEDIAG